jgi:vacuolar-type H+-ATPase subunit E/Vma4
MLYIDEALLAEASERVRKVTGRTVKFSIADDIGTPGAQGVVLTDRERRVAFNNLLDTRLLRKERRIQTLIYDALFRDLT